MKRSDILDAAKQAITVDRAATHGNAENSFGLIAEYWSAHLDAPVTAVDVATMMGLFKLARAAGNPGHIDNWTDAAGYAALGGEMAHRTPVDGEVVTSAPTMRQSNWFRFPDEKRGVQHD